MCAKPRQSTEQACRSQPPGREQSAEQLGALLLRQASAPRKPEQLAPLEQQASSVQPEQRVLSPRVFQWSAAPLWEPQSASPEPPRAAAQPPLQDGTRLQLEPWRLRGRSAGAKQSPEQQGVERSAVRIEAVAQSGAVPVSGPAQLPRVEEQQAAQPAWAEQEGMQRALQRLA